MRKCQQDLLYTAERVVEPGEVMSLPQAQAWIDDMLQQPWWGEWYGEKIVFVEVFKLPGGRTSVGGWFEEERRGQLEMAPSHMTPLILLHELAHVCAAARFGSHAHDPWFARTYLELVYVVLGWEKYRCLKAAFDDHGVDADVDTSSGGAIAL